MPFECRQLDVGTLDHSPEFDVAGLVDHMNSEGYACIENFIKPEALSQMRGFVASAVQESRGNYVCFKDIRAVAGSTLDELYASSDFKRLIEAVFERGAGWKAPDAEFYFVLRCLTGPDVFKHSLLFHYDSFVVTALVAIDIPDGGDLILLPNRRPIRSTYAANLVDKLLLDNKLSQVFLGQAARRNPALFARIKPIPGNLYIFWGYRSIHANEAFDPDKVRSTALYHFADPHAGSWLKKLLGR